MSRYIGKRVSYPCAGCDTQFTLTKKCHQVEDRRVLCPKCTKNLRSWREEEKAEQQFCEDGMTESHDQLPWNRPANKENI
jgi:DNA-directed RNA polymerase subunit RPC12/RpoP